MKAYHWTNSRVIYFTNWFLRLHKLPERYQLENMTILDSFKRGDDFKLWHKNIIPRDKESVLKETKDLLMDLHNRLDKVGTDFDWNGFVDISLECQRLQTELKMMENYEKM